MSQARWNGAVPQPHPAPRPLQRLHMVLRGLTLFLVTYVGIAPVVILNLLGLRRASHAIVRAWGRICLWLCGLHVVAIGSRDPRAGAVVANHAGWVDIFALLAADGPHFVSKAEVAGWPVVGWLSRQIGTEYIDRRRSGARRQTDQLIERLDPEGRLCFFPEGTSTDGQRVLPFKSTLFAAFFDAKVCDVLSIQPITLRYRPPEGLADSFYGWWGEMDLGPHVAAVFALSHGARVEAIHHPALKVTDFADRKALAAAAEAAVRHGMETGQPYPAASSRA